VVCGFDPIDCHETVVENIAFLSTVKVDLWWSKAVGVGGVRSDVEKIKTIHIAKVALRAGRSKVLKVIGAVIF
jgi:hypothetical protein